MQEFARESKSLRKYSNITSNIKGSPKQNAAISLYTGPSQIIAGPGAGKTFVLVSHIDYLIRHYHVDPYSILVLTFSKASALEMNERYINMPSSSPGVSFGTFHSVFFHILNYSGRIRYSLIDGKKKLALLKMLLSIYFPDSDESDISVLSDIISSFKTDGIVRFCGRFENETAIRDAIKYYDSYLEHMGMLDFDDMILKCLDLLSNRPDIRKAWQERFRFILVDEFQDINNVQYKILKLLSQKDQNLFVVGDDDQSIYGFRGAGPGIMHQFVTDFPDTKRIFLSENYRCKSAIVASAIKIINENKNRIPKNLTAVNASEKGESNVLLLSFEDQHEEYAHICDVLSLMSTDELYECAVIFRTHMQARAFCRSLRKKNIPFKGEVISDVRTETEIMKDIYAYYKMAADLSKGSFLREDYYRVMNRPDRYLGRNSAESHILTPQSLLSDIPSSSKAAHSISDLLKDLTALYELPPSLSFRYLLRSMQYAKWRTENESQDNKYITDRTFKQLSDTASKSCSCEEFLFSIKNIIDNYDNQKRQNTVVSVNGVNVMTMHAVKGLEYMHVFIPDLNEGIVPNKRAVSAEQIEEERRLLYVAMTRAKIQLEILYLEGTKENPRKPSRFLLPLGVSPWQK